MMLLTNRLLLACITAATAIFSAAFLVSQTYVLALLGVVIGALWLYQARNNTLTSPAFYFLAFVFFAVAGCLQNLSTPLMLVGMTANLAAWDLSRFYARLHAETDNSLKTALEKNHLQKLGFALAVGVVLGLIPLLVSLSVNFIVLMGIVLVAMLIMRRSMHSFRSAPRDEP